MKYLIATVLLASSVFFGNVTYAEEAAAAKFDLTGTWKLDITKNSLNDRRPHKREDTWVFKNGTLTILHIPRAGTYYDQLPEPYKIENDQLIATPMGSSKSEIYSIVEKNDDSMTLKGKFGTYYYFSKK
jgi:hypothetical protein